MIPKQYNVVIKDPKRLTTKTYLKKWTKSKCFRTLCHRCYLPCDEKNYFRTLNH